MYFVDSQKYKLPAAPNHHFYTKKYFDKMFPARETAKFI